MIDQVSSPGWPYSFVAALEAGPTSWAALLDVVRLAWLLDDLPVTLIARLRSDRVFYTPAGTRRGPTKGQPPRHGARLVLADPTTHPEPSCASSTDTARYGHAQAAAFARMHPKLSTRSSWSDHDGELPIIEGTVVELRVARLPGDRSPTPVWLWVSKPVPDTAAEVDHWWSMYLRRFDLEHTFRFLKQTLGWTRPRLRDSAAADRWTWIILVAHTQLWLARPLARDHRLPWHKPLPQASLTPARGAGQLSPHLPDTGTSRRCAETHPPWPRTPTETQKTEYSQV